VDEMIDRVIALWMSESPNLLEIFMWMTLLAPLIGCVAVVITGERRSALIPWVSLFFALITFVGACGMFVTYRVLIEHRLWSKQQSVSPILLFEQDLLKLGSEANFLHFRCLFGVDGISVALIWLVSVLGVSSILISMKTIRNRIVEYYALVLVMLTACVGFFLSFDLLLFYLFFEFTLLPMFFLIGIWGGPERRYAAGKFFIYTFVGSLIGLVALLAFVVQVHSLAKELHLGMEFRQGSCSLVDLAAISRDITHQSLRDAAVLAKWSRLQIWVFWGLFLAFGIKVPLVPLHTWLPLAHVEAPTAGSVFLAGILLKLGTYGFLKVCLPLLPTATLQYGTTVIPILALVGIIYGSFCAAGQIDIKRLIAYSSIAHMGFCMLGMMSLNTTGLSGSVLEMVNHGLSTGGLFLLVGMLYDRYHSRLMGQFGGLAKRLPIWAFFLIWLSMASIALPGLNGFISETLCLAGMFRVSPMYAVLGAVGIILGAWYMLEMIRKVVFGPLREPEQPHGEAEAVQDLNMYEWLAIALPAILCLVLGLYPKAILDIIRPDVQALESLFESLR
jgi:NADH-quinone oxidoreductase subunit M